MSQSQEIFNDINRKQINIAIIGAVSVGKSTLLNSLFVSQYSDMKIKRTTMTPQVYYEVPEKYEEFTKNGFVNQIKEKNREINQQLTQKSENNQPVTYQDIQECQYIVPKVHKLVELINDIYLTVYDIPGLNDHKTKDIFYQYINQNFYKFDVVIFMIDINSSLNTSDEEEILSTIITNIKNNKDTHQVDTKLIILANKCDDMNLNKTNNQLSLDDEHNELLEQIKNFTKTKATELHPELTYSIFSISCEDSYIYRMYDRDPNVEMDQKYVNKFGFNEFGKSRWNKMSDDDKKHKIKKIMKDVNYPDVMKLSGFEYFREELKKILEPHNQYLYLKNHLVYQMNQINQNGQLNINPDLNKFKSCLERINEINKHFKINASLSTFYQENNIKKSFDVILDKYLNEWNQKNKINEMYLQNTCDNNIVESIKLKETFELIISYFPDQKTTIDKWFLTPLNDSINKYYQTSISAHTTTFQQAFTNFKYIIKNNWNFTVDIIKKMFSNPDLKNQTTENIIKYFDNLKSTKTLNQAEFNQLVFETIKNIYLDLINDSFNEYINQYTPSCYAFHIDKFWTKQDSNELVNIEELQWLSKRAVISRINHQAMVYKKCPMLLEKYYLECILQNVLFF